MSRIVIAMLFAVVCFAAALPENDFVVPESDAPEETLVQDEEQLPPGVTKKNNNLPADNENRLPFPAKLPSLPGTLLQSKAGSCKDKWSWCNKVYGDSPSDSWSCYHRGDECRTRCCNCGKDYWKNYCSGGSASPAPPPDSRRRRTPSPPPALPTCTSYNSASAERTRGCNSYHCRNGYAHGACKRTCGNCSGDGPAPAASGFGYTCNESWQRDGATTRCNGWMKYCNWSSTSTRQYVMRSCAKTCCKACSVSSFTGVSYLKDVLKSDKAKYRL